MFSILIYCAGGTVWVNRFANAGDAAIEAAEIAMERVYIYINKYITITIHIVILSFLSDMASPHLRCINLQTREI